MDPGGGEGVEAVNVAILERPSTFKEGALFFGGGSFFASKAGRRRQTLPMQCRRGECKHEKISISTRLCQGRLSRRVSSDTLIWIAAQRISRGYRAIDEAETDKSSDEQESNRCYNR